MKMRLSKPLVHKLSAVKALKNITGLGLKDAKNVIDSLGDNFNYHYKSTIVDVEILNNYPEEMQILMDEGIIFEDREDTIDELLVEFVVKVPSKSLEYKVFDGNYTTTDGVFVMTIISGKRDDVSATEYHLRERELNNIKITMDFSTVIIEENI